MDAGGLLAILIGAGLVGLAAYCIWHDAEYGVGPFGVVGKAARNRGAERNRRTADLIAVGLSPSVAKQCVVDEMAREAEEALKQ